MVTVLSAGTPVPGGGLVDVIDADEVQLASPAEVRFSDWSLDSYCETVRPPKAGTVTLHGPFETVMFTGPPGEVCEPDAGSDAVMIPLP